MIRDMQNHVEFHDAVDALTELGFKLPDLANALGCSAQYVRMMRMWDGSSPQHRAVPPREKWRPAFNDIVRRRAEALRQLADEIEGTSTCG